jgi:hypothetical protein
MTPDEAAAVVAVHVGSIRPLGEIADVAWVGRANRAECADAIQLVIDQAVAEGLLAADP